MALAGRLNQGPKKKASPAPPLMVEARVGIQAPAEVIWDLLADIRAWPTWNPLYPKAAGELGIAKRLNLTIALPGEPHREIEPQVLDWVPLEQIHWSDLNWGGWVKSVRYIEIEEVERAACIVTNGEVFRGMVAEMYGKRHRRALRSGYLAMLEALKENAERIWRDQKRARAK